MTIEESQKKVTEKFLSLVKENRKKNSVEIEAEFNALKMKLSNLDSFFNHISSMKKEELYTGLYKEIQKEEKIFQEIYHRLNKILGLLRGEVKYSIVVQKADGSVIVQNMNEDEFISNTKVTFYTTKTGTEKARLDVKKDVDNLLKNEKNAINITSHYRKFDSVLQEHLYKHSKKVERRWQYSTRYVPEAFMRHFINLDNSQANDDASHFSTSAARHQIILDYFASMGNATWTSGGDIGLIQVKGINEKRFNYYSKSAGKRIDNMYYYTSVSSLDQIVSTLMLLENYFNGKINEEELVKHITNLTEEGFDEKEIRNIPKNFLKKSFENSNITIT